MKNISIFINLFSANVDKNYLLYIGKNLKNLIQDPTHKVILFLYKSIKILHIHNFLLYSLGVRILTKFIKFEKNG